MKTNTVNLFIVEDNRKRGSELHTFLGQKFGKKLMIRNFMSRESVLKNLNHSTAIVILDKELRGDGKTGFMAEIKKLSPNVKVIVFSSKEEVVIEVDSAYTSASEYIIKDRNFNKQLKHSIKKFLNYPVDTLVREFSIGRSFAIFCVSFLAVFVFVILLKIVAIGANVLG